MKPLKALLFCLISTSLLSQQNTNLTVLFGSVFEKKPIPYPSLREADVMWSKRVWQVIDLREKINHPLYYPIESISDRKSLMQTLYLGVTEGELTAFSAINDEFTIRLTSSEVIEMTTSSINEWIEQEDGTMKEFKITEPFYPGDIIRFRIKEEWFFDNQRSALDKRIIGICPVMQKFDENGNYKGELPLFWIYFPEVRRTFANTPVFNTRNDAERISLDDVFLKRRFSSYIYKVSNVYNRKLNDYLANAQMLLESQKIKEEIFNLEQDLWEY